MRRRWVCSVDNVLHHTHMYKKATWGRRGENNPVNRTKKATTMIKTMTRYKCDKSTILVTEKNKYFRKGQKRDDKSRN